ncbi:MAG: PEP-CTERM sorting domain-containing protein [Burkholderiales bacterium]|nr:PEP-CTERM sorting domain-containing protein [Burkholderiales bacterium]
MRTLSSLLLAAALATPLAATAGPSLLTNGSFEDGPALPLGSWNVYTTLPGWQGDPTSGGGIELRRQNAGTAQDGTYFVELDTYRNSWMEQSVATTAGTHYTLSWYYSPRAGVGPNNPNHNFGTTSNQIQVLWNGVQVFLNNGSGDGLSNHDWHYYSVDVVGTGGLDMLRFAATGTSDGYGGSLDNIALNVPEPVSLALTLGALGLMGAASRRRVR